MHFIPEDFQKISKRFCGTLPYFGSASYLNERMPMGLNISPSIWQSYINAILDCLQSRKYCEAVMDNLLLFTPANKITNGKIRSFVEGSTQEQFGNITHEMSAL